MNACERRARSPFSPFSPSSSPFSPSPLFIPYISCPFFLRRAGDDVSPHSGDGAVRFGARLPCAERGTCVARQLAAASCVVARVVRGMTPRASLVRFLCTLAAYAAGVTAVRASDAVAVPVCRIAKKKPPPCARCAPSPALFRCSMFVLAVPRPVAPRTGWLWHWDCVCDAMQTGLERCRPRRDATTGTEASCASRRISLGWLVLCEPAERLPWRDGDPRLWRRCAAPGRAETSAAV